MRCATGWCVIWREISTSRWPGSSVSARSPTAASISSYVLRWVCYTHSSSYPSSTRVLPTFMGCKQAVTLMRWTPPDPMGCSNTSRYSMVSPTRGGRPPASRTWWGGASTGWVEPRAGESREQPEVAARARAPIRPRGAREREAWVVTVHRLHLPLADPGQCRGTAQSLPIILVSGPRRATGWARMVPPRTRWRSRRGRSSTVCFPARAPRSAFGSTGFR